MAILADFNIICLNQEKPEFIEDNTIQYDVVNLNTDDIFFVGEEWKRIDQLRILNGWGALFKIFKGIWYYIYPSSWKEVNYVPDKDFFDYRSQKNVYATIANVFKYKKDGLLWSKNRQEDIKKIINFYLDKSPIKRIFIMCKVQGNDHEAIVGTMTKREFFSKMNRGELRFNVAYIVKDN